MSHWQQCQQSLNFGGDPDLNPDLGKLMEFLP